MSIIDLHLRCFLGLSFILVWIALAGGENTETRRNGDVCFSACYYVLCHVGPSNPQRDTLLICKHSFFLTISSLTRNVSPLLDTSRVNNFLCRQKNVGNLNFPTYTYHFKCSCLLVFFLFIFLFLSFSKVLEKEGERQLFDQGFIIE